MLQRRVGDGDEGCSPHSGLCPLFVDARLCPGQCWQQQGNAHAMGLELQLLSIPVSLGSRPCVEPPLSTALPTGFPPGSEGLGEKLAQTRSVTRARRKECGYFKVLPNAPKLCVVYEQMV